MRTNAGITLYNKYIDPATRSEKYARSQVPLVAWETRKGVSVNRTGGYIEVDQSVVYIPFARGANYLKPIAWQALSSKTGKWTIQPGDFVVKGLVADEIGDTFTVTALSKKYDDVYTVSRVDANDQGSLSLRHWEVGLG